MIELKYKNLDVWKKSMEIVSEFYRPTTLFPKEEQFGPTSQIGRFTISIPSNIREGLAISSNLQIIRFLYIARPSLPELDTQIQIASDLSYLNNSNIVSLTKIVNQTFTMLSKLIQKNKNDEKRK